MVVLLLKEDEEEEGRTRMTAKCGWHERICKRRARNVSYSVSYFFSAFFFQLFLA